MVDLRKRLKDRVSQFIFAGEDAEFQADEIELQDTFMAAVTKWQYVYFRVDTQHNPRPNRSLFFTVGAIFNMDADGLQRLVAVSAFTPRHKPCSAELTSRA